jgi:uncharacterized membrane protein
MTAGEALALSTIGIPIGLLLLALLSGETNKEFRRRAMRWCLAVGAFSTAITLIMFAMGFDLIPNRGTLGMVFIGLPALPAGLLLRLFPNGFPGVK